MSKTPFDIPTMAEVRALPWNGYTVASTFAGCGGASTGFRMAGFKVGFASEFVEEARATYKANCSPETVVDGRDIRQVPASDILDALGMKPGDLDILDGSPPCSSFSTAGKRHKLWGKTKSYSDTSQRTDDLFGEFVRLVRDIQPKVFVAENVKGLTVGTCKGQFIDILRSLKGCGYSVVAKVVDASWLGVPQARQRTVFIGTRNDLGLEPAFPKPFAFRYSLADALDYVAKLTTVPGIEPEADINGTAIGTQWDVMGKPGTQSAKYFQLTRPALNSPCPTITAAAGGRGVAGVCHPTEKRKFSIGELKALSGVPADFILTGTYRQQYERLGRIHCPLAVKAIAEVIRDDILRRINHA